MTNELSRCCAFTGHRPAKFPWKYDEQDHRCTELKAVLAQQIKMLAAAGVTDFFPGWRWARILGQQWLSLPCGRRTQQYGCTVSFPVKDRNARGQQRHRYVIGIS